MEKPIETFGAIGLPTPKQRGMNTDESWRVSHPFRATLRFREIRGHTELTERLTPIGSVVVVDVGAGIFHVDCESEEDALRYNAMAAFGII